MSSTAVEPYSQGLKNTFAAAIELKPTEVAITESLVGDNELVRKSMSGNDLACLFCYINGKSGSTTINIRPSTAKTTACKECLMTLEAAASKKCYSDNVNNQLLDTLSHDLLYENPAIDESFMMKKEDVVNKESIYSDDAVEDDCDLLSHISSVSSYDDEQWHVSLKDIEHRLPSHGSIVPLFVDEGGHHPFIQSDSYIESMLWSEESEEMSTIASGNEDIFDIVEAVVRRKKGAKGATTCMVCGKKFKARYSMESHFRAVHDR